MVEKSGNDEHNALFLLIGYYCGYLYLVRVLKKEVKILKKYNRASDAESGFLSKTFSFFSGSSSAEYTAWQTTTVVRVKMYKKSLSYMFRNGILVILSNLESSMEDIQKKF